jgi:anti-sigma-K factor RskA
MVSHEQIIELLPAYALDCLDEEELLLVAEHLNACADCQREVLSYQMAADQIPLALPQSDPPSAVKGRLMDEIAARKQATKIQASSSWLRRPFAGQRSRAPTWAIASLVVVVVLFASNLLLANQVSRLQKQNQSSLPVITLQATDNAPGATGSIVISMDGAHGTMVVDGLPTLNPDQEYQLWLIKAGQRTSGGVFSAGEDGYGFMYVRSPSPLADYDGFGITIEPAGGSPAPTGAKVLGS